MTMSDRRTILLCAMMVTVGPISMALLTPAMPQMAVEFGATDGMIARTLTLFLFGFAAGQLISGPLSDRFGRRPIALIFTAIYTAASILALLAPSLETLLLARLLQGIGVSSGLVISRAIVRDAYEGRAAARIFSTIAVCNAIVPMLSPSLGAISTEYLGWHWLFAQMALFGGALLTTLILFQSETLAFENRSISIGLPGMLRDYSRLLADGKFLVPAVTMGAGIGAIYMASILMPFIVIGQIGLSNTAFGLIMGLQTLSYISGAMVYNRLQGRLSETAPLRIAFWLFAAGLISLLCLGQLRPLSAASYIVPIMIWVTGNAFAIPNLTSTALQAFADKAGAASAMLGFIQILFASLGTFLFSFLSIGPDHKILLVFLASAIVIALTQGLRRYHAN